MVEYTQPRHLLTPTMQVTFQAVQLIINFQIVLTLAQVVNEQIRKYLPRLLSPEAETKQKRIS